MKQFLKVVVPFTELEWSFVKENVMSDDVELLEQVLNYLCLWESRTGSNTPIFIQMTKLVVQAIHYDRKYCLDSADSSNVLNATSIYGLSLTRVINYLNNIAQPKAGNLVSIANALKPFGIPEQIVHLRQNVVHDEMPSINELRDAVQFCREWLWESNWKYSMAIAICDPRVSTPIVSVQKELPDLRQLFTQFWNYRSRKTNNMNEKQTIQSKAQAIVDTIQGLVAENLHEILSSFSSSIVLSENKFKPVKAYLQLADFTANKEKWEVSVPLFNVWQPMFDTFSQYGRLGALINHWTTLICDEFTPVDNRHQLVAWTRFSINEIMSKGHSLSVSDLNTISQNVINATKFFEFEDFKKIIDLFAENEERKTFYKKMWKLKRPKSNQPETLNQANDENCTEVSQILTLASLKNALEKRKGTKKPQQQVANTQNWSLGKIQTPLGLTGDQTAETLDLKI